MVVPIFLALLPVREKIEQQQLERLKTNLITKISDNISVVMEKGFRQVMQIVSNVLSSRFAFQSRMQCELKPLKSSWQKLFAVVK